MSNHENQAQQAIEAAGARSIAADSIGTAYSGDVLPAEALYAPDKVTAAPGTSNLPPATLCLGREEELSRLRSALTAGRGEGLIAQGGAVHGLGGIGKSTVALHYAHRHRGDYSLIWWINAASPDEIETSFTRLTCALVPGWAVTAERGAQVAWALQWLAWHPGWLLIYDNVEDAGDLAPYTGALHNGHHLATSRRATGWPDDIATLTLGTLDPEDAVALLCRLVFKDSEPTARQWEEARRLASDVGHFPLAVRQAGAYLAQNRGVGMDAYRRRLGTKLAKAAHGADAQRTVARIWDVTLQALEKDAPLAVELLHTAAWLAPDGIPHTLLAPPGTDPDDTAEAIGVLAAYSMVTDTGTTLSVHRLVQTVLRQLQNEDSEQRRHLRGRERAEQAVARLIPDPDEDATADSQWDALIPHLVTLAASTPPGHQNSAFADVYRIAADRLHDQGHTARTIPLMEATLAEYERVLGATHPDTLTSRGNLASAYASVGDAGRAIPLMEATLAQCERVLGDTDPAALSIRNNLADVYHSVGDMGRAIPLMEATLAECVRVLGDSHPNTLTIRNNLAGVYQTAGDPGRALPLFEATLAQRERVLGGTHPATLTSRNNLAGAYRSMGDLERAIPLYEATLAECERVLGDASPITLTSRNNLADVYRALGDLGRAIPLIETTLAQCERVLGVTHPDTLTSRNNLAGAYQSAGDLGRALQLFEATLAQREQALGESHPDTLTSRNNLAGAYKTAGDLGRALQLFEATLAQRERVMGGTHPDTLTSRNNLAGAYRSMGDLERAIPLYEATLAECERVLGDTFPITLTTRNNLACAYQSAGDPGRAIPLFEATLAECEQVLGDTHPHTLTSRKNLAYARRAAQRRSTESSATDADVQPPPEPEPEP
ncbi:tetratricopeptide repeat protein [Streptomyces sp. NPDC048410]|uniref:tetratricopeptide repeat protein n=1 Tax=Streptomyces sp. NPDC048410 TaxID=3365545 RepID=UPI00371F5045